MSMYTQHKVLLLNAITYLTSALTVVDFGNFLRFSDVEITIMHFLIFHKLTKNC